MTSEYKIGSLFEFWCDVIVWWLQLFPCGRIYYELKVFFWEVVKFCLELVIRKRIGVHFIRLDEYILREKEIRKGNLATIIANILLGLSLV